MSGLRVGIDVGGTFTDVCLYDDATGRVWGAKVPTDVADQGRGVVSGIEAVLAESGGTVDALTFIGHGMTVALNALLERKGGRIAFVTTLGFRDVLELGRQQRPELYNFFAHRPAPLAPRELRYEVAERTTSDGTILQRITPRGLAQVIRQLKRAGVDAVAIAFINSYRNPDNEARAKELLAKALPNLPITCSYEIAQEFREFERFSSAAMNAYLLPSVSRYMASLGSRLRGRRLRAAPLIFQSNGAVMGAAAAAREPVRTLMSGPAGGVLGAAFVAGRAGLEDLITFDMGGTSTDVALIEGGRPSVTSVRHVDGYPVISPSFGVRSIGAGGGSIAWVDTGGFIKVGPQSAGAEPGPAAYGRGGEQATVTDADVVLGYLNPAGKLAGRMALLPHLARKALDALAARAGVDVWMAAAGAVRIVTANIARLIRLGAFERGRDPRDFTLVAFGGAGPLHAGLVARELGIRRIFVPAYPGLLCAVGMLVADLRADFSKTLVLDLPLVGLDGVIPALLEAVRSLERRGHQAIQDGELAFDERDTFTRLALDLRYKGQNYEITVPLREGREAALATAPATVLAEAIEDFHGFHERIYGRASRTGLVQLVTLRLGVGIRHPKPDLSALGGASEAAAAETRREIRLVDAPDRAVTCLVRNRRSLKPGEAVEGPAILEQMDSTILVLAGQLAVPDGDGNLTITEVDR